MIGDLRDKDGKNDCVLIEALLRDESSVGRPYLTMIRMIFVPEEKMFAIRMRYCRCIFDASGRESEKWGSWQPVYMEHQDEIEVANAFDSYCNERLSTGWKLIFKNKTLKEDEISWDLYLKEKSK